MISVDAEELSLAVWDIFCFSRATSRVADFID